MVELVEKNMKLQSENKQLLDKVIESQEKMAEMLNEANNVYEEAGRKYAMEQNNEFSVHQNGPQGENMDSIINQNFLRESIVQAPIDALPTNLV